MPVSSCRTAEELRETGCTQVLQSAPFSTSGAHIRTQQLFHIEHSHCIKTHSTVAKKHCSFCKILKAAEMAQQVKALAGKAQDLSSMLRTHRLPQLFSDVTLPSTRVRPPPNNINTCSIFSFKKYFWQ